MFSSILPDSLEKVLYLDCDIVILGDISEFWNTDLSGCGAACVDVYKRQQFLLFLADIEFPESIRLPSVES